MPAAGGCVCSQGVLVAGGVCSRVVPASGVPAWGGCLLWGVCLLGGVPAPDGVRSCTLEFFTNSSILECQYCYRSGKVNSKSFVGKVLLRIKRKFKLTYAL